MPLDRALVPKLIEDYRNGDSIRALAVKYHSNPNSIWVQLIRFNVPRRKNGGQYKLKQPQLEELVNLYGSERWTIKKLCQRYGVCYLTLVRTIQRMGLTRKSYTQEQYDLAVELYKKGYNLSEISRTIQLSFYMVQKILCDAVLPRPGKRGQPPRRLPPDILRQCVVEYVNNKRPAKTVGAMFDVSRYVIIRELRNAGVVISRNTSKRRIRCDAVFKRD